MLEVLADKIKHYFVNLHKHIQIMKIILKREGEAYSDEAFLSEKVEFEI